MNFPRLPIEKFDENGLLQTFYINIFSDHLNKYHSDINHPHKHDFYLFVLFTKGQGVHSIDFQNYTVEPGAAFFLQPEQIHDWHFTEEPEGWIFFHSENFYKLYSSELDLKHWPFFQSKTASHKIRLEEALMNRCIERLTEIREEYLHNIQYSFLKIANLCSLIYSDLGRAYINEGTNTSHNNTYLNHFSAFTKLLETHYLAEKKSTFYASKLGVSTKHLHRICKAETGKSTSQIIADRTVLEAKRKLVSEQKTIQEIAFELGFESVPYFQLFFKKHAGETPKNFRDRNV